MNTPLTASGSSSVDQLSVESAPSSRKSLFQGSKNVDWKGFVRVAGFDTMPDADFTWSRNFSFTQQIKSEGYVRTKKARTFMCAVDATPCSERALEWLMENLVDDGDQVVAVRILDEEVEPIQDLASIRESAQNLLSSIVELNETSENRRISVTVEFVAGYIRTSIMRLVVMYRPDSLTISTRGKQVSALQKMLGSTPLGSISKYLIWQSPVPVIIVRPEDRVRKHLSKRMADPRRREYQSLVGSEDNLPMRTSHLPWK
ncbi:hypothetical protein MCUN1_000786 [Malassezia cuniculi]|uniref:UspA domain-containing protein n=1 Tax=Malassezia cuniculi TaxID=948313 RepID=A0AAF0J585_9BASI|nr:hypothetical protein MCUN1_000786 [Malassezia cuniculi]